MQKTVTSIAMAGLLLGLGLLGSLSCPTEADAIPAFARKYRMSCTTCHAPFPRLKAYGDEFAGNGFVLEDQDAPRYFVETGDDDLDLIRELPLAIRLEGFAQYQSATKRNADFSAPYNLKLLSGGSLTKNIGYYFYFFFSERGEVAGVEDAYIHFNNLFNSELDIMVGQFQVSDPLFKREVRLPFEDYQVYKARVGQSAINLAYERGVMITYGFESGTDLVLELLNGNGIGAADEARVYDDDKYKNVAARMSQGLGDYLRIGGFGYYGKEGESHLNNEVTMLGADASLTYRDIAELNLQWLERRDDNPLFAAAKPADKAETQGALAELVWMPQGDRSRWYAVALYNRFDSDLDDDDYETITAHVGHVLKTNIRLILENTYDIQNEENRIVSGFVVGL